MLTVEDMHKAIQLNSAVFFYPEDNDWYSKQRLMTIEFLKNVGMIVPFDSSQNSDDILFSMAALLLDKGKLKEILSRLNNKAFW